MVTKQQLQNMLDETIEELEKPTSEGGPMGQRFRQLLFHRANLEMKLRDLEKPEPENSYQKYYEFFTTREEPTGVHRRLWGSCEEELFL